jgi:hypothetical protein
MRSGTGCAELDTEPAWFRTRGLTPGTAVENRRRPRLVGTGMKFVLIALVVAALPLLLTACGGGGGY